MRKIKTAQIGTSKYSHGNEIFCSLKKQNEVFELVGYALPEGEREKFPEKMNAFEGYREMSAEEILNDPEIEAVVIETEEKYLTKYAIAAAEHGKHIHMEKPGGTSLDEFEKLIKKVKDNGKVFHTGYMYRYNPCVKELMQKIKNGELGEIINVEAQMNGLYWAVDRQWLDNFPGGIMFFLGCHLIDLILQIKGVPEKIIPLSLSTGINGITSKDFGMAVLQYKDGISFAKVYADEVGGFARRQLVVAGTKGTVEIKPFEVVAPDGQYTTMHEYKPKDVERVSIETSNSAVYDRYDDMLASFAAMVRGEKENPWGYDYELELYKTILKSCSAESR